MDSGQRPADYVLFYATLATFPEDAACAVKHACRRAFHQAATDRGLMIDKLSAELPTGPTGTDTGQGLPSARGRRGRKSRAPYKAFYWGVQASATALLREAESARLELPMRNSSEKPVAALTLERQAGCGSRCVTCSQSNAADLEDADQIYDQGLDFLSTPFVYSKKRAFFGCHSESCGTDEDNRVPLTAAQRIYLTHSLLSRIDISPDLQRQFQGPKPDSEFCTQDCVFCSCLKERIVENSPIVLEHLLEARIFADAFALHEADAKPESEQQPPAAACCPGGRAAASVAPGVAEIYELTGGAEPPTSAATDARKQLRRAWLSCCGCVQPLRLIRQYFGEKLAFYYAWLGHIIASLHCLNAIGLACLVYGLVNASLYHKSEAAQLILLLANATVIPSNGNAFAISLTELMQFIRLMFDNCLTIPFGCVLTAWHLATAESWKSSEAALSHRWGVKQHDLGEKPSPAATPERGKGVSGSCKSPQLRRCFGPLAILVFCAAIAIAVAVSVEVSKLVAASRHCGSQAACILLSVALPIGGHLVVMTLLDWGYSHLAKKMTDWEKHQFQSDHDSAYAIKAFAFRFANNFASMLYAAFVRQQQVAFGDFTDGCVQNKLNIDCFNMLSIYAAGYIIGKSLLKLLVDFVAHHASTHSARSSCLSVPLRRLLRSCGASLRRAAYAAELDVLAALERRAPAPSGKGDGSPVLQRLARERARPAGKSADQQLDDYLEKMTLHGYLVMFGSACYVAPLAVLVALLVDRRLDASRLTRSHRRPTPQPAQGVGVWNRRVRDFLGHAGLLTTAGILSFASDSLRVLGLQASATNRLVLFIAFSGAMYLFKYLVSVFYSGRSDSLQRRLNWEYQNVPGMLDAGSVTQDALDEQNQLSMSSRWCPALFPCFAAAPSAKAKPQPQHLV